jgi:hypothetical protein
MSPVQLEKLLCYGNICVLLAVRLLVLPFFPNLKKYFIFFRYLRGLIHLPVINDIVLL